MERMQLRKWARALLIGVGILATSAAQAAEVFRVAYAGSMGVVMDRFIGPLAQQLCRRTNARGQA